LNFFNGPVSKILWVYFYGHFQRFLRVGGLSWSNFKDGWIFMVQFQRWVDFYGQFQRFFQWVDFHGPISKMCNFKDFFVWVDFHGQFQKIFRWVDFHGQFERFFAKPLDNTYAVTKVI
jgi:hypothetical protein